LVLLLMRPNPPPVTLGIVVAAGLIPVESLIVVLLHQVTDQGGFDVVFLLDVLVVSTVWGLTLATTTSVASAIAFEFFREWPPGVVWPMQSSDIVVTAVFLAVALLANSLAGLARARAVALQASTDSLCVLAEQQAALRRVATLVANGTPPTEVFAAVAEELARCLRADSAQVGRYEADGTVVLMAAAHIGPGMTDTVLVGERSTAVEFNTLATEVFRTGRPARMDRDDCAAAWASQRRREPAHGCGVAVAIVVDSRLWGIACVSSSRPLPADTEGRISDFAELVATALANAATRAELIASRSRIVAAADGARRRIERDLHDGAQQRLVSLGLELRTAESSLPPERTDLKEHLGHVVSGLTGVSNDLRQISRGIHPAILSKGGLGPALKTLARRCTVPVRLDVAIDGRLEETAEVAAYYVVAEALTNAAKHAHASQVTVWAQADATQLLLSIRDDGIGGAQFGNGSGLIGLKDRVEALGGQIHVRSLPGSGTTLNICIPTTSKATRAPRSGSGVPRYDRWQQDTDPAAGE
jgi:signal transduction histidine kinase